MLMACCRSAGSASGLMLASRLTGVPFGIGPIRTSPRRPFRKKITNPITSASTSGEVARQVRGTSPVSTRSRTTNDRTSRTAGSQSHR